MTADEIVDKFFNFSAIAPIEPEDVVTAAFILLDTHNRFLAPESDTDASAKLFAGLLVSVEKKLLG